MTDSERALRAEIESSLTEDSDEDASVSPLEIELSLRNERDEARQRELVLAAMRLPDRGLARSALREFAGPAILRLSMNRPSKVRRPAVTLAEVYAATVLALLDDRSGIPILKSVGTLTNSQIEFFFARGALTLLREPIPPNLENERSVFRWREQLVDACHRTDTDER